MAIAKIVRTEGRIEKMNGNKNGRTINKWVDGIKDKIRR
jgi:hypothetical protein